MSFENKQDFIYINDEAIDEIFCSEFTQYVNENKEKIKLTGWEDELPVEQKAKLRDDYAFFITSGHQNGHHIFKQSDVIKLFDVCKNEMGNYLKKYTQLNTLLSGNSYPMNFYNPIMKYHIVSQGGGYHAWHSEWVVSDLLTQSRVLAWHLSLTTHEEEGELEFLYQGRRIAPKAGRMIIFPAAWTHVHRGNSIRKNESEKHYLTGWWYIGV